MRKFLSAILLTIAISITGQVSHDVMNAIYEEAKTPYKYGPVIEPVDNLHATDCPTVFRMDGKWFMSYVVFNGDGYETWLSSSDDLIHWTALGRILPFREGAWDAWQACGFPALGDMTWGGSYKLETYEGRYWMSYFGGPTKGYEQRPLSLGLASIDAKTFRKQLKQYTVPDVNVGSKASYKEDLAWDRPSAPFMRSDEPEAQSWENGCQYKTSLYINKEKKTGHKFLLYYNAYGTDSLEHRGAERIGLAFSEDMKTWKRYAGNPIVHHRSKYNRWGITGDPQIQSFRVKGQTIYTMFYFRAIDGSDPKYLAYNTFACSTDLIHWTDWDGDYLIHPSEKYDAQFAHKSFVVRWKGVTYHFYCAVDKKNRRCIALATSRDLTH